MRYQISIRKVIYFLSTLCIAILPFGYSSANVGIEKAIVPDQTDEILELSRKKWSWMIERQIDSLDALFDEQLISRASAVRMDKAGQIDVIENGNVRYKHIDILDTDIQIDNDVSILLTTVAFLGRNEESVHRSVTEVYKKQNNAWTLLLFEVDPV